MKTKKRDLAFGLILTLILLISDQITKFFARTLLAGTDGATLIPGVLKLSYVENTGAAFGMLGNRQVLFIAIAVLIIILAIYVYICIPPDRKYHLLRAECILIAAGAAGNMTDRLYIGYVTDFLEVLFIHFPVFNLADCFVCVGVFLVLFSFITVYRKDDFSFLRLNQ